MCISLKKWVLNVTRLATDALMLYIAFNMIQSKFIQNSIKLTTCRTHGLRFHI